MKNIIFFLIALLYINTCFAQEAIIRKKKLNSFVTERYHSVIGKNKEERQGEYQALYNKTPIATGQYTNDKKTGIWNYYNKKGELIEKMDYDKNTLLLESFEDTTSNMRYMVDAVINPTDKSTKPVRIGGRYFGYINYLRAFKMPEGLSTNGGRIKYPVKIELLVSPGGRLADFKIHFYSALNGEDIFYINLDALRDEDRVFIPATLNGQPVACRIFIQCYVNEFDELDMH